jgi:hypothetical protein
LMIGFKQYMNVVVPSVSRSSSSKKSQSGGLVVFASSALVRTTPDQRTPSRKIPVQRALDRSL